MRKILLREFQLPLSQEKKELLGTRKTVDVNGRTMRLKKVYGRHTVKIYGVRF